MTADFGNDDDDLYVAPAEPHPNDPGNGHYRTPEQEAQAEADVDRDADRDREPEAPEPLRWRAPDLAALIVANNRMPWVSLRIGADQAEIVHARVKSMIMLTAPTGAGKSSLALEISWRHALTVGPAVYLSLELDADEAGGRIVGQRCLASWEDALKCMVPADHMAHALDIPRLVVLAGEYATVAKLESAIGRMRVEYPGQPVLVVVDYVQLLGVDTIAREERAKVSGAIEFLRRKAQVLEVLMLVLSQTSRAAATQLKEGSLLGADTTATGAETSQIEKAGTLTISLGGMRPLEDRTTAFDLNVGKGRMGQGDRVYSAIYDGRTGLTKIVGESRPASEVKVERAAATQTAKVAAAADAIAGHLAKADEPKSVNALVAVLHTNRAIVYAAVDALLAEPEPRAVRVKGKKNGGRWPVWNPAQAAKAGLEIVPESCG